MNYRFLQNIIKQKKDKKYKEKKLANGYMTLEVTLLFPVIFTIIMLLIYLSFYLYDRCLLENSAYIAALRGSRMQLMNNDEIFQETNKIAGELVEGRLFSVQNIKQKVTVGFDKVTVEYDAKVTIPVACLIVPVINKNLLRIHIEKEAKRINTIDLIRAVRKLEQITDATLEDNNKKKSEGKKEVKIDGFDK